MTFVNHIILPMLMPHIAPYLEYAKAKVMCKEPPNRDEAGMLAEHTTDYLAEVIFLLPTIGPMQWMDRN